MSLENGLGEPRTIQDVAEDGAISFTDGSSVWHHDPTRLCGALDCFGNHVYLGTHGVLRVPNDENSSYCFCVAEKPDPCRPETAETRPGESLLDELVRRGGLLRSGTSVLAEVRRARSDQ
jgi:hypothetical protein